MNSNLSLLVLFLFLVALAQSQGPMYFFGNDYADLANASISNATRDSLLDALRKGELALLNEYRVKHGA